MEPPPPPPLSPCLSFFERIPHLEQIIFVEKPPNLTEALQLIKEFFSSIGVSPDPDVRSEYPKLIDCKIPVNVISIPGRKESLDRMVKSIHGHHGLEPIITCSVYIEDVLTLILKKLMATISILALNLFITARLKKDMPFLKLTLRVLVLCWRAVQVQ